MDKFLVLGNAGWCKINIGVICFRASYLTDVPIDCLKSAINYLEHGEEIYIHFDSEGCDYWIRSSSEMTFITTNGDEIYNGISMYNIDAFELSKVIYRDISSNIDGWCDFLISFDSMEWNNHKDNMTKLLNKLSWLLDIHKNEGGI